MIIEDTDNPGFIKEIIRLPEDENLSYIDEEDDDEVTDKIKRKNKYIGRGNGIYGV